MQVKQSPGRIGRPGKIFITLTAVLGVLAVLLYLEQLAIIYIGSTVALIVLLIVVACAGLETIGANAADEAYMTRKSENILPADPASRSQYDGEIAATRGRSPQRLSRREA